MLPIHYLFVYKTFKLHNPPDIDMHDKGVKMIW